MNSNAKNYYAILYSTLLHDFTGTLVLGYCILFNYNNRALQ